MQAFISKDIWVAQATLPTVGLRLNNRRKEINKNSSPQLHMMTELQDDKPYF